MFGGLLSAPEEERGMALAGLLGQIGAAFAPSTDPGARAQGLAAAPMAMMQGRMLGRGIVNAREEDQQRQAWRQHLAGLPEDQRALYAAMGPQRGAQALMEQNRRREGMAALSGLLGGGMGGAPASPGFTQQAVPDAAPAAQAAAVPPALMPHFEAASRETGIPLPLLLAQARQESNYDPNAVGRAGEIGIGQILPSTARNPGFGLQGVDPETLRDPAQNILFQARYLAARGRAAGVQDWSDPAQVSRALNAYNGGGDPNYSANVTRYISPVNGGGQVATSGGGGQMPAGQPQGNITPQFMARLAATAAQYPELAPALQIYSQMFRQENPNWRTERIGDGVYAINPQNPMQRFRLGDAPESAPLSPGRFEQERTLREAGRTNVTQNAEVRGENAEAARRGTVLADEEAAVRTQAETAASTVDVLRQARATGAQTGRLAPLQEAMGGWLDALGIDSRLVRQASNLQAFQAAASSAVLSAQLQQKGVATEGDARRIEQTFAQVRNTPQANDFILRAAEAQALRLMERDEFYRDWRAQPGADGRPRNTVDGAGAAWRRFIRETPLVTKTEGGAAVFFSEFMANAQAQGVPREDALKLWRERAR